MDLSGGSQLIYQADVSKLSPSDIPDAMDALKGVIERRVNVFGVGEPIIQSEQVGIGASATHRLVVELPGVSDLKQAEGMISQTPSLEFRLERADGPVKDRILAVQKEVQNYLTTEVASGTIASIADLEKTITDRFGAETWTLINEDALYVSTGLDGKYLERASVQFNQNSINPSIGITFTSEGAKLFAQITEQNIGKSLAIYLDGKQISAPTIRDAIRDGRGEISGQFSLAEAKDLVKNLNLGALPVPISLVSTQTIGATLGTEALAKGIKAGMIGFLIIAIFMILWYRLPGVVAVLSLSIYITIMLAIFKLIPVTLTAAGIAGFILSIGIAVDANVLIFERLKEEINNGKKISEALHDGFSRAWTSIRDSNTATILSSIILFWFGSSLIKGFGLNLAIGVIISMFTAITVTRTFLLALGFKGESKLVRFLFSSGLSIAKGPANK
ncbi:MAG: protein translocase subunit SecD [Candidatus Vogelbacteria bacterium CG22_combo_CG10-13_8_21_14_all_37_9]|uniref:Protein translocase subunit SecD n=1 Tax=Candidatus Vogelbacteria bacterium CG22_combo_CG10-13_8_21_14_all_37_9 TaxID=1975046 RepID=A0A2H0BLA5_9BACT|nr:MAG: protein translocase subunit SecD [Candidatus Vogelbacteria bacterium CG22_combo_CG10-13_8_21_14_all_37_9]